MQRIMIQCAALGATALTVPARAQCSASWSTYPGPQLNGQVRTLVAWDPDAGAPLAEVIVAGGDFTSAGSTPLAYAGVFDGSAWRAVGSGLDGTVASSVLFPNPPSGRVVPVIGGYFGHTGGASLNEVAILWDGAWAPLSTGTSGIIAGGVTGLASYSGGLAASGFFSNAGGVAVQGLARWDGAAWHAFADDRARYATMLANLGGSLVAGGYGFLVPGSTTASTGVLRWNGVAWESIGPNPPPQDVFSLGSYRERAVVGGMFHNGVGEPPAPGEYITIFDGASWQPLGTGMNGPVYALCEFDPDGPGPGPALLIAGGTFTVAGGQPASGIAAWDGSAWAPLGSGTSGTVKALGMWRGRLAVGGSFFSAGGLTSPGLAFWGCPQPAPCYANCNGGTTPPVLNVADFTCFLQQYSAGCMGAWPCYPNCDDSTAAPFLNVADFTCFLRKFAAGCP